MSVDLLGIRSFFISIYLIFYSGTDWKSARRLKFFDKFCFCHDFVSRKHMFYKIVGEWYGDNPSLQLRSAHEYWVINFVITEECSPPHAAHGVALNWITWISDLLTSTSDNPCKNPYSMLSQLRKFDWLYKIGIFS